MLKPVKVLPDAVFWAGGPEVSYDAEDFLQKNSAFTGVMVEAYYNSGQFWNALRVLEPQFPDAFSLYQTLGDFYEEKGYAQIFMISAWKCCVSQRP